MPPAVAGEAAIEAAPAVTVHALLGYGPFRTPRFTVGPDNPLQPPLIGHLGPWPWRILVWTR